MNRSVVLAALAIGCSNQTFTLGFRVTDGLADACKVSDGSGTMQVTQCQQVPMTCAAVANIRVFNPNTPTAPIINVCQELLMAPNPTLCEVAEVNLPPPMTPVDAQTLQVEILVYPKNMLDVDMSTGMPVCPGTVNFGADGFPAPSLVPCMPDAPCEPTPAIGGTAFYHPGDAETIVELGCADLKSLNDPVCIGASTEVTATVTDFDTLVTVPPALAQQLVVAVGQPMTSIVGTGSGEVIHNTLDMTDLTMLTYAPMGTVPGWMGTLPQLTFRCLQVDESNVASRTDTVRCIKSTDPMPNTLAGTRLSKMSLDQILAALNLPTFPDAGLVIGLVLDNHGNPAAGIQVTAMDGSDPSLGTIEYLSAMRNSVGGNATSTSGIFVSRDMTFGTLFTAMQGGQSVTALGGRIDGKVTIVVLQLPSPPNM